METVGRKHYPCMSSTSLRGWELGGGHVLSLLSTMQGHHQEVWGLALSPNGDYVVSASHDKSLRLWERTREPLVLEEEREMVRVASFLPKTTSRPVFSPAGRFLIFHCGRVWLRTWQTC